MRDELPPTIPTAGRQNTRRATYPSRVVAGRYVLERVLGEGGQAEVWEARDELTRDRVAVKILHSSGGIEPARVRREIATLRRLRVPGVVALLDEGVDAGDVFLVMERLDGTVFPGRPQPLGWDELRTTALALLETLARVHAAGVIHRGLKPGNVLVSDDGRPTLLDFGVSWESLGAHLWARGRSSAPRCTSRPSRSAAASSPRAPTSRAKSAWSTRWPGTRATPGCGPTRSGGCATARRDSRRRPRS